MNTTDIEKLEALAKTLGVEVYHTDPEGSEYHRSDGSRVSETWMPKTKDIVIIRHRSAAALWHWQHTQFQKNWNKDKEVNHGG